MAWKKAEFYSLKNSSVPNQSVFFKKVIGTSNRTRTKLFMYIVEIICQICNFSLDSCKMNFSQCADIYAQLPPFLLLVPLLPLLLLLLPISLLFPLLSPLLLLLRCCVKLSVATALAFKSPVLWPCSRQRHVATVLQTADICGNFRNLRISVYSPWLFSPLASLELHKCICCKIERTESLKKYWPE